MYKRQWRNRAAARDDGETMKLMMVLLPAGLLLMPLGANTNTNMPRCCKQQ